jgi:hypothetical protein
MIDNRCSGLGLVIVAKFMAAVQSTDAAAALVGMVIRWNGSKIEPRSVRKELEQIERYGIVSLGPVAVHIASRDV